MKKIIYGIMFGALFILPVGANALTTNTTVDCGTKKISSGDTVTCTFKTNVSEGKLAGFSAHYDLGEGVTYKSDSFEAGSSFQQLGSNNNGFNLMNTSGVTGNVELGKAKFIVTGNPGKYKIGLKNLDLSDEEAAASSGVDTSTNVTIASSDNTLKSLSISENGYSSDKITQIVKDNNNNNIVVSAVVDEATINVLAVANSNTATVDVTKVQKLKYGVNEIKITVTAENGKSKEYTLTIVRPDNRSANNFLKSLTIKGQTIEFNKGKLEYEITVDKDISELEIEAEAEDEKATVKVENTELKMGENEILINVTAENETVQTYKIKVIRGSVVEVPDTAAKVSTLVTIIGIFSLAVGFGMLSRKKKFNK